MLSHIRPNGLKLHGHILRLEGTSNDKYWSRYVHEDMHACMADVASRNFCGNCKHIPTCMHDISMDINLT